MQAGVEDPVIGPQQFLAAVAGDAAELLVDVRDPATEVGFGKDRGRIDSRAVVIVHEFLCTLVVSD
ncbi:hypothetical protein D3C75_1311200 [compost metagenome]